MKILSVQRPNVRQSIPLHAMRPGEVATTGNGTVLVRRGGGIFSLDKDLSFLPSEIEASNLTVTLLEPGTVLTLEVNAPERGDLENTTATLFNEDFWAEGLGSDRPTDR